MRSAQCKEVFVDRDAERSMQFGTSKQLKAIEVFVDREAERSMQGICTRAFVVHPIITSS